MHLRFGGTAKQILMGKRYFTSDFHFNSTLINKYANRPRREALDAGIFLVCNANAVLSDEDVLFHVGDFCLTSPDRHGKEVDYPLDFSPDYWKTQLKGRLVLLAGNHDDGHSFAADCKSMVLDLNQNYRNVYVNHFPSDHRDYHGLVGYGKKVQINLCGHVHDKWLLFFDAKKRVLNVNVSVDVWNYKPVNDAEITELLDYFRANLWTKIANDGSYWSNFALTRDALEKFKIAHSAEVKAQREVRKAEKHLKKGLTQAECERRRIEAMKKKGLI